MTSTPGGAMNQKTQLLELLDVLRGQGDTLRRLQIADLRARGLCVPDYINAPQNGLTGNLCAMGDRFIELMLAAGRRIAQTQRRQIEALEEGAQ